MTTPDVLAAKKDFFKGFGACDEMTLDKRIALISDGILETAKWVARRTILTPYDRECMVYRGPEPTVGFPILEVAKVAATGNIDAVRKMLPSVGDVRMCSMFGTNNFMGYANSGKRVERLSGYDISGLGKISSDIGGCSSPLFAGTSAWLREAEAAVADLVNAQDAAIFPSGFMANVGAIATLVGPYDAVVMDADIHMSIRQATWGLRGAKPLVFKHNDIPEMVSRIRTAKQAGAVEIWVIVESIYSMEGKMAPLREIADATKKEGGRLFIDDSHAVGVLGPHGAGGPAFCGLVPGEDYTAHVFSLCKAFNAGGGAICGASGLVRMIRYRCIAYSFSAGIAEPLKLAMCARACKIDDEMRARLSRNIKRANELFTELGVEFDGSPDSPLMKVNVSDAISATVSCMNDGVFVNYVAFPAVPRGHEILRISICACHEIADIERLCTAVAKVKQEK